MRYSEKLLERAGISVETLDLSEVFGRAARLKADDPALKAKLEEMQAYVPDRRHAERVADAHGQARRGD